MGVSFSMDDNSFFSEESIQEIKEEYFLSENQVLVHKGTNKDCLMHCIHTTSKDQSSSVQRNIDKYKEAKCKSVSKFRQFYLSKKQGYCTNQKKYFLIFESHYSPNLNEEYLCRRHKKLNFSDLEIQSILSCFICGLKEYYEYFGRKQPVIDLQSVLIEQEAGNKLTLRDPWLSQKKDTSAPTPIDFFARYPSPQKIDSMNNCTFTTFDDFSSDLFSIGIYGLQLLTMNFRDDIYEHKKFIDFKLINEHIRKIRNSRIRQGLSLLLSDNIFQRNQIVGFWGISCLKKYCLNDLVCAEYITQMKKSNQHAFLVDIFHPNENKQIYNSNQSLWQPSSFNYNSPQQKLFSYSSYRLKTSNNSVPFPYQQSRNGRVDSIARYQVLHEGLPKNNNPINISHSQIGHNRGQKIIDNSLNGEYQRSMNNPLRKKQVYGKTGIVKMQEFQPYNV